MSGIPITPRLHRVAHHPLRPILHAWGATLHVRDEALSRHVTFEVRLPATADVDAWSMRRMLSHLTLVSVRSTVMAEDAVWDELLATAVLAAGTRRWNVPSLRALVAVGEVPPVYRLAVPPSLQSFLQALKTPGMRTRVAACTDAELLAIAVRLNQDPLRAPGCVGCGKDPCAYTHEACKAFAAADAVKLLETTVLSGVALDGGDEPPGMVEYYRTPGLGTPQAATENTHIPQDYVGAIERALEKDLAALDNASLSRLLSGPWVPEFKKGGAP